MLQDKLQDTTQIKEPLYLIDGYGILFKTYFAMVRNPLTNEKGENISALLGFINSLRAVIKAARAAGSSSVVVLLDSGSPTFRHDKYPEYKANRTEAPEDLKAQIHYLDQFLPLWGLPHFRAEGYEADDLIATLAARASKEGRPCYIVTRDKDLYQLIDDSVRIVRQEKGKFFEEAEAEVLEKWGVAPLQMRDYLALVGDSSDNIPGVKGIGPKGAVTLLQTYGSIKNIYLNIDSITPETLKNKLKNGSDMAFLSYDLVGLCSQIPFLLEQAWDCFQIPCTISYRDAIHFLMEIGLPRLAQEFAEEERNRAGNSAHAPIVEEQADDNLAEDLQRDSVPKEILPEAIPPETILLAPLPGTAAEVLNSYQTLVREEQLDEWCNKIRKNKFVAMDCETTGLNELSDDILGISLATGEGEACYIPIRSSDIKCLEADHIRRKLQSVLDDDIRIIGQNFKFDYKVLSTWGLKIHDIYFDTMIAAWLLDSLKPVGMDALAERYLRLKTIHFKDIVEKGSDFSSVPIAEATKYAAEDADVTWQLYQKFLPMLKERKLDPLFFNLEMPLIKILGDMEIRGIYCCKEELEKYADDLQTRIEFLEGKIRIIAGEDFNMNSPQQLAHILYEKLGLPKGKKTKQGYSTNSTILESLQYIHPIITPILEYRRLTKLLSTYVKPLPSMILKKTQRIHTRYSSIGAETGRLSSRDPNLQNIPIKDEEGRKIRSAFKPQKSWSFYSADYSQIELVVLAHLSEDPGLCEAFLSGRDIHQETASRLFRLPLDRVSTEQRRIAKSINFGVIYGMSAFRLSQDLGLTRADSQNFINAYFHEFSGVRIFIRETIARAREKGYVETLEGRQREIIQLRSNNKIEQQHGERMAINTVIQGSAADIVKRAMISIEQELAQRQWRSQLLLQVHDELIFESPPEEQENLETLVLDLMENAYELRIPLRVKGQWSSVSWGELH